MLEYSQTVNTGLLFSPIHLVTALSVADLLRTTGQVTTSVTVGVAIFEHHITIAMLVLNTHRYSYLLVIYLLIITINYELIVRYHT